MDQDAVNGLTYLGARVMRVRLVPWRSIIPLVDLFIFPPDPDHWFGVVDTSRSRREAQAEAESGCAVRLRSIALPTCSANRT